MKKSIILGVASALSLLIPVISLSQTIFSEEDFKSFGSSSPGISDISFERGLFKGRGVVTAINPSQGMIGINGFSVDMDDVMSLIPGTVSIQFTGENWEDLTVGDRVEIKGSAKDGTVLADIKIIGSSVTTNTASSVFGSIEDRLREIKEKVAELAKKIGENVSGQAPKNFVSGQAALSQNLPGVISSQNPTSANSAGVLTPESGDNATSTKNSTSGDPSASAPSSNNSTSTGSSIPEGRNRETGAYRF